ncbi:MAG: hypothetical protein WC422_00600 [Candidatus Paceibacterota bacterium]|jgi:hypothetical protein
MFKKVITNFGGTIILDTSALVCSKFNLKPGDKVVFAEGTERERRGVFEGVTQDYLIWITFENCFWSNCIGAPSRWKNLKVL